MRETQATAGAGLTAASRPDASTGQPAGTSLLATAQPQAWPSWARAFPGTAQQARAARQFVASLLAGSPLREDAILVMSELFTNAITHTDSGKPGGLVIVQVSRWLLGVRIAVTDQGSARTPTIRESAPGQYLAEHGHGLHMVACLAKHLEWHDDTSGRTVHAILGANPPAAGKPQTKSASRGQVRYQSPVPALSAGYLRSCAGDGR